MKDKILVEVKNGHPYIEGRLCSYETKKIRRIIWELSEVNKSFFLPTKYSYEITPLNGFAKIIKAKND